VPFLARDKRDTTGLVGLTWRYAAKVAKVNSIYAFDILENLISHRAARLGIHKIRSIIDQQYVGDINILPSASFANLKHIVSNPSLKSIRELIHHGERATWPKLDLIKRNTLISKTIRDYLTQLKQREARLLTDHNGLRAVNN
jgi:TAG lipase/steryl ester hydrolase/phospholipase A2/LPA acyltransferase